MAVSPTEQIKKMLSETSCLPALLVIAPDDVRPARILKLLEEKFLKGQGTDALTRIRGAELNREQLRRLRDESAAGSLFCSRRFIVVAQVDDAAAETQREVASLIESRSGATSEVSIILTARALSANSVLLKTCQKHAQVISLPELKGAELNKWIGKELRTHGIAQASDQVLATLADIGAHNPDEITKLCEHLALYIEGDVAAIEDVYNVFISKISADEFKLIELVTQGRTAQAEVMLSSVMRAGKNAFPLLGLFARNFQTYYSIKVLLERGMSTQEVGASLHVPPWLLQKHLSAVRHYSLQDLRAALEAILRADSKLKNRSIGPDAVLSEMIDHLAPG